MLSQKQIEILQYLYRKNQSSIKKLQRRFHFDLKKDEILRQLWHENYVKRFFPTNEMHFRITEKGKAYVENHNKDVSETNFVHFHQWVNTILAIIALIISILAYIKQ